VSMEHPLGDFHAETASRNAKSLAARREDRISINLRLILSVRTLTCAAPG
jgi:hypothetical protein